MSFSHVIYYVADIEKSLKFFKEVFDLETKFFHESGAYAELDSGPIALAFVSESLASLNLPEGYKKNSNKEQPLGCEIVFTSKEVNKLYRKALQHGAKDVAPPKEKPWGQIVAYIRDPNGILVEIGSPIAV